MPETVVLTLREIAIVRLVAGGPRNKEIADELYITEGTVKVHVHNTDGKLKVGSRLALLGYASLFTPNLLRRIGAHHILKRP